MGDQEVRIPEKTSPYGGGAGGCFSVLMRGKTREDRTEGERI